MATGLPPPTFSWSRVLGSERREITLGGRYSIPAAGTGDGSLTIDSVEISDSSSFICTASNSPNAPSLEDGEPILLRVIGQ